jgi:hypothetical protein
VSYPIRQKSLRGQPKPGTSIERCCACCGASFIGLGKTEEGGIWHDWRWYCSVECHDELSSEPLTRPLQEEGHAREDAV